MIIITIVFIGCILMCFGWHFEVWHAVLAEVPAAALLLLSLAVLCTVKSNQGVIFAGCIFSTAILTKLIALIAAPCYIAVLFLLHWRPDEKRLSAKYFVRDLLLFMIATTAPIIFFETAKLLYLGIDGFKQNWSVYFKWLMQLGVQSSGKPTPFMTQFLQRTGSLNERFGIQPFGLLLITLIPIFFPIRNRSVKHIAIGLTIAILSLSIYWLFMSVGWPRYYIIAIILVASLSALLSASLSLRFRFFTIILIAGTFLGGASKLNYPFQQADHGLFRWSTERQERETAAHRLQQELDLAPAILTSRWWGTFSDLQFHLHGRARFVRYTNIAADTSTKRIIYASNVKFDPDPAEIRHKFSSWQSIYEGKAYFVRVRISPVGESTDGP